MPETADADPLDRLWSALRPDADGLCAVVVQHAEAGQVLMLGMMNREALALTLATRKITFWSRSRRCLWQKGETSGNTLDLTDLWVDCDGDALLARALPRGPTCHTLAPSCFYRRVDRDALELVQEPDCQPPPPRPAALAALDQVEAVIRARIAGQGATQREGKSYVRSLVERGPPAILEKLVEEAGELGEALALAEPAKIDHEAADLLFHALVGLASQGRALADVSRVLAARLGVSGLDEKANRPAKPTDPGER